ncbi:MAG: carbamate kinase, partial [Acidobacteriota bacterium]
AANSSLARSSRSSFLVARVALGSIGAALARSLILVTLVRVESVEAAGPASKPVGAYFTRYRAEALKKSLGWEMVETAPGSWRRVVSSPRPVEVLNGDLLRRFLVPGMVVIAGGGGGVPMAMTDAGRLVGVEAVVDKDHVAGLLAAQLKARRLLILTNVDHVYLDYGKPTQRPLRHLDPDEAGKLLDAGQFPAGSMGPKIEAAARFVSQTGGEALITSPEALGAALEGSAGTRIKATNDPAAGSSGSDDGERSSS